MKDSLSQPGDIVKFLRRRDYKLVRELGQGACGKTVLLHDDQIGENFVCKKYVPYSEAQRQPLFAKFVQEIKLLHQLHHNNVVRVFNYYLYPEHFTGYILMEFIDGSDIDDYVKRFPEQTNELFVQAIDGFAYLERSGILHRDIRPGNVMVRANGTLKIIDMGFGKRVEDSDDFEKSISLNWWCQTPDEFDEKRYDFGTEVYFVGKMFERIIQENNINHFKHMDVLREMCNRSPFSRLRRFSEVETRTKNSQFFEIEFEDEELSAYRNFADSLCRTIIKIESGTKYATDLERIRTQLNDAYRSFMLEANVPDASVVIRCFLDGTYYFKSSGMPVHAVSNFLRLLKSTSDEKARIILANLHTKLDSRPRYSEEEQQEVPF
ncbi:protein kinase domain-containing protein [Sorangium cellulosum]|uniref:protein kinase domain-containing protein n=1 Tax=Sorangium cellulosum TaxID=56 RepID=UPI0009D78AB8|nr:protein kinase [Sorangium cellulosum]